MSYAQYIQIYLYQNLELFFEKNNVLFEKTIYDEVTGQLLTGSFMDYAIPRAADVPNFNFNYNN